MTNTHYKVPGKALALCNAFGFLYPGEMALIQAIARSLSPGSVAVQIGAGVGTGSLAMAEIRPDLKVYTVDISKGGPYGGLLNEVNAFQDTSLPLPKQLLGNSQEIWKSWPELSGLEEPYGIDLILVDADHTPAGLQRDIDGWLPFVKVGGYALFHDYESVAWHDITAVVDRNLRRPRWRPILVVDTLAAFQRTGSK